jgi:GNAT superfamily N-acetyltransferase
MSSSLSEGFRVRPATVDDAPAINELVIAVDNAVQGWSDSTEVEDGSLVAYGVVIPHCERAETDGFVHPAQAGRGLGSWLIRRGQERAREMEVT